jgi:hypothetical protein
LDAGWKSEERVGDDEDWSNDWEKAGDLMSFYGGFAFQPTSTSTTQKKETAHTGRPIGKSTTGGTMKLPVVTAKPAGMCVGVLVRDNRCRLGEDENLDELLGITHTPKMSGEKKKPATTSDGWDDDGDDGWTGTASWQDPAVDGKTGGWLSCKTRDCRGKGEKTHGDCEEE